MSSIAASRPTDVTGTDTANVDHVCLCESKKEWERRQWEMERSDEGDDGIRREKEKRSEVVRLLIMK